MYHVVFVSFFGGNDSCQLGAFRDQLKEIRSPRDQVITAIMAEKSLCVSERDRIDQDPITHPT